MRSNLPAAAELRRARLAAQFEIGVIEVVFGIVNRSLIDRLGPGKIDPRAAPGARPELRTGELDLDARRNRGSAHHTIFGRHRKLDLSAVHLPNARKIGARGSQGATRS